MARDNKVTATVTPTVIGDLIEQEVLQIRDQELWDEAVEQQESERDDLKLVSRYYGAVVGHAKYLSNQ